MKNKIIKFLKNEINEINLILKNKKIIKNPFKSFKYLAYIPLSILAASLFLIFLLVGVFLKINSSYLKYAHNARNKNNENKDFIKRTK